MAVEHLLAANEPDAALGAIARAGEPGLEDFMTDSLSSWINRLPLEICRNHPWARLLSGQLLMRAGDFDAALLDVDAAARACRASDDRWGLYHALSAKECTLFWQGDVEGAVSTCDEALKYTSTDAQKLHTLLSMGSAALDRRDWVTAERAFDAAGELDRHASPGERTRAQALRASVAYYKGHFRQALALSPQAVSNDVSAAIASVVLNMNGLIHIAVGQYHSALSFLEQAKQTEQKVGHSVTANMITDNIGLAMSGQGHLEEGLAVVTASAKLSQESGADSTLLACTLNHQASILRRMGRETDALDVCRLADKLVPLQRDPYLALNTRANLLFTESLLGRFCHDDLLDVAKNAEEAGLEFVRLKAHLYLALVAAESKPLYASQILQEYVPQQLHLGHIHLLAQELVPRPSTALLALSSMPTEEDRKGLLDALAHHWRFADVVELLRDEDPELLIQTGLNAIDHVDDTERADKARRLPFDKDSWLGPQGQQQAALLAELTPRELDVLFLMTMGLRNPDIARTLFVSSATVKTHINHIFSKLAVTTRVQAILKYQMANMKPPTHLLGTSENQPTSLA
jgi:ATP/maltotriose-dependent transcriptional regulator MalT